MGSGYSTSKDKSENKSLELIWHFKNKQPNHHVDFTIEKDKNKPEKTTEYIEVKSTTKNGLSNAKFGENEVNAMRKYGNQYKIWRIYNAGNTFLKNDNNNIPNVRIKKIENPKDKLFGNSAKTELGITSLKLKI